jgi:hypothetical protein
VHWKIVALPYVVIIDMVTLRERGKHMGVISLQSAIGLGRHVTMTGAFTPQLFFVFPQTFVKARAPCPKAGCTQGNAIDYSTYTSTLHKRNEAQSGESRISTA